MGKKLNVAEEDEEIEERRATIRQGEVEGEGDEEVVVLGGLDGNHVVDDDIGVERQMSSDSGALEVRSQSSDVSMVVILADAVGKGAIGEDISRGELKEVNDSSRTTESEVQLVDANDKLSGGEEEKKEVSGPGSRDGKVRNTMC